jgi:crossover junction endodeoxyribonuclease RusA
MIELRWPPTVNHYYTLSKGKRPRKILSEAARAYKKLCHWGMLEQGTPKLKGPKYCVSIFARPPDNRKRDLDNLFKPILDALVEFGAITDDSNVDDLRIVRLNNVKNGSIQVLISEIKND